MARKHDENPLIEEWTTSPERHYYPEERGWGERQSDKAAQREGSRAVIPRRTRWAGDYGNVRVSQPRGLGVPAAGGKSRQGSGRGSEVGGIEWGGWRNLRRVEAWVWDLRVEEGSVGRGAKP